MQTLTLNQLRGVTDAGGVTAVRVKAQGSAFYIEIGTRGGQAILTKARSHVPRRFGNPMHAMSVLRELGIVSGTFDVSQYDPDQADLSAARPAQAEAMRQTHKDAAYLRFVEDKVERSRNDPRPSVDHATANARFAARRAALRARIDGGD